MYINITFFIQVIHFIIVYQLLNRFFFKPILNSLNKRYVKEEKIKQEIAKKENELLQLKEKKLDLLRTFQHTVQKKYAANQARLASIKQIEPPQPPKLDISPQELEIKLTNLLMEKVQNEY